MSMRILNQVPTARFQFEVQESGLRLEIAIQGERIKDSDFRSNDYESESRSRSKQGSMTNIMMNLEHPYTMPKM